MPSKPKYQTIAGDDDDSSADIVVKKEGIEVIILDFTHSRFSVQLPSLESTILDLKTAGALLHSVNVNQQRLIYQGKLLTDESSLQASGICNGSIVHLFPKPRVVVVNNNNTNSADSEGEETSGEESRGRVPTIVLDQDEADRRGQILVLGNSDYVEAVNNVKLFSFMLLIISTIELLNLMAVALGEGGATAANDAKPYIEHDDFFPSAEDDDISSNDNETSTTDDYTNPYQTWTPLSWIDLVVSVLGIYVALLGIRASNENALVVARLYMIGTAITGIGWLVYNFIINFEIDEIEREQGASSPHPSMSNNSVFNEAVQAMVLPAVVWGLCVFRAWQFQHLLAEAEQEAIARIQSDDDSSDDEEQALQTQTSGIVIS